MSGTKGMRSSKTRTLPETYQKDLLDGLDQRSKVARLLRERYASLVADQGELSYVRQSLCWRFAHLEAWLVNQEKAMMEGRKVDESKYLAGLNSYVGLVNKLGLDRRAKQIKSLADYLASPQPDEQHEEPT